ncbi:glycosyltransferase family 2 protein [Granulibacter bethesdensis]|uniref:Glycosyl transferase family protein n=1 Tax=Granulibacter bethesdensis (strain ATCC BAA-1260 / CGDNIH1) TaxID=391165 RepID=Q0BS54_GRABC|nr:glycosyltransferase family 2 protein [Granulibacter bethesdensis]ABI62348.1 Glycosyl transferase family protein [Granulibacter bethesdensis CGDNIH1]APH52177.1 Glycosyl transferase family protein [Granulibacter bethesdensis]APH64870.1 Glycosyl transferase family protein [Granulibacter bethesdensis]
MSLSPPLVSIVIAALNEEATIDRVCDELIDTLDGFIPFEVVVVDDGSTDQTPIRLSMLRTRHPALRVIRHPKRCGKTAALFTGVEAARGTWIVTMDADGQNDPRDVPAMVAALRSEGNRSPTGKAPLVAGIRRNRIDTQSRRHASRLANGIRARLLRDDCPDTGCGVKAFSREDFLRMPAFEGMHRFMPALFRSYGHTIVLQTIHDRARLAGQSKYTNFGRLMVGIRDTLGVMWLRNRIRLPQDSREV